MASFTEQATLKINDQSSAQIRKINAELKKLFATANQLKSRKIDLNVSDRGIAKAVTDLRRLATEINKLRAATSNIRINLSTSQAQAQLSALRAQAQRPASMAMRAAAPGSFGRTSAGAGGPAQPRLGGLLHSANTVSGSFMRLASSAVRVAAAFGAVGGAVAVSRAGVQAVVASEDARMRLMQSGFTPAQTDLFMAMARKSQEEFKRIPAAAIANASVEQLNAIKAANGSFEDYQHAMNRIAKNAQIMAVTFKDPTQGAESSRQLERVSQILGKDIDRTEIQKVQEAAMRAIIATGGEMKAEEMVRVLQQLGSSIAKSMSAQALTDIMMIRDEGGRASTAEWRMAVQELGRGTMNPDDKAAMTRVGLRGKGGRAIPALINEAATDLVGFTEKRILPILKRAGKADKSSAEIAVFLDEVAGYSTSSARGIADIVTSLRDGELQRQRAAARAVNLDPRLGDQSFRGAAERLSASFDTALARPLDKMGPVFTAAIDPFAVAMDRAGKAAEKGEYATATGAMVKAGLELMGGPVGQIASVVSAISAVKTLIDPTATTFDKGSALLVTGATTLSMAAGAILKHYDKDPVKQLGEQVKEQEERERRIPEEIADIERRRAAEVEKGGRNQKRLAEYDQVLERKRIEFENVQDEVRRARQRLVEQELKKAQEVARVAAEDRADMERLQRESGLAPKSAAAAAAAAAGIETPVRAGFPVDPAVKAAVKQAAAAAAAAARQAADTQRAMFPAYRRIDTKERVPAGRVPMPRARPEGAPPPAPEKKVEAPAVTTFTQALERLQTSEPTWLSAYKATTTEQPVWLGTYQTVTSSLATTNSMFAMTFSTGASAIGGAGTVAADALASRAGGIGSILGNAAGDALAAKAASITVAVAMRETGADTGARTSN